MRRILVAVDDSTASVRVSEFVNDFFAGMDVRIIAVNVGHVPLAWGPYPAAPGLVFGWPSPMWPADPAPPEAAAAAGERQVPDTGLDADEELVEVGADVAETLRRVATARGASLLVVGSSDKGVVERLLAPSVSAGLAKDAPVPVLVVH